ncbi:MAG: DUF1467 family protein [Pseudomonadota bacterium]
MGPVSGIVLFAVIWFLVLFVVLPLRLETQGDRGEIVPGTQAGAPANLNMWKKARLTTLITAVLWGIAAYIIWSGAVTLDDLQIINQMRPPSMR